MKQILSIGILIFLVKVGFAQTQTNTFPSNGNVGIGILGPQYSIDVNKEIPEIRLLETTSGNRRRFEVSVGRFGNEITFLSSYGTGGNYPFVFRFGGGVQEVMRITRIGDVGIGTTNPQAKLAVNGNILAKEVKVKTDISVPDYVFAPEYELPALADVEAYVKEHRHLPEIPSAKDIERDGLDLAEMNLLLLKKVEELTLHLIEKEQIIEENSRNIVAQHKLIDDQNTNILRLQRRMEHIENNLNKPLDHEEK
ncbi:hypothetical protein JHJ32_21560 [Parapedobacter sp. ISTM3]|uniref:hypothetical protein n=1 Tax=Parapedobacter sp. ISTM3 TaxID=2800130 RepID=UPI0019041AD4|nr:hypothetical protein [Parapedobacter sp. ISTM3]MBK1442602.1 hypothetical protein [Parapedobacter sp. ISTM3]